MPTYRGVAYDVGSNFATGQGELSRTFDRPELLAQLDQISGDLNCNAVTLYGTELERLSDAGAAAAERGLSILLDPRQVDRPQSEVLDHLAEAARIAESLRREGADIRLTVGAAHSIFTPGINDGDQYHGRMANIYADAEQFLLHPTQKVDWAAVTPRLDDYLARATAVARDIFGGELSYSATPHEDVDWRALDSIGLMYFYQPRYLTPQQHIAEVGRYRKWGKPIDIAGYGSATYAEAEQRAFFFWDIVDRSGPELRVLEPYVRDEAAQAAYHRKMLDIFARAGVRGVFVTEFIHPTHPHSTDPRLDLDTASLSIVKTIRDDVRDPRSPYRWEPKESFHAIADCYATFRSTDSLAS